MATYLFTRDWLSYSALVAMGHAMPPSATQGRLCLLAAGQVALTANSPSAAFIAAECTTAGYTRTPLGLLCSGVTSNVIQVANSGAVAGQRVSFYGTALPAAITQGTPYFVKNPITAGFEVSATSGGATIALTSIGSGTRAIMAPAPNGNVMQHVLTHEAIAIGTTPVVFRGLFTLFKVGSVDLVQGFAIYDQDITISPPLTMPIEVTPTF